ncbi:MAG: hypothetical protein LUD51_03805 [Clostridia bacterium]|nr:hypothetical protein [Clostridia bacterium]
MAQQDSKGYILKEYFSRYITEVQNDSVSTAKHYLEALKYVSKILVARGLIKESIYEVESVDTLQNLNDILNNDPEYVKTNKDGHNMYSVGMNHYIMFARGEGFADVHSKIEVMDIEVPRPNKVTGSTSSWVRNGLVKRQAMQSVEYICEVNPAHTTFIQQGTSHPYMEGHHLIAMSLQGQFDTSLDSYANIVCLCPICHRLMHYGRPCDKKEPLDKIYADRADRLANTGIRLSRDEFENFVL